MAEDAGEGSETPKPLNGKDDGGGSREEESSGSSSSDSESDEKAENTRTDTLEKAVADNPSDYEAHLRYIQHLRKLCHMEKLRQARKYMSELFPLTPQMWLEWASDEATLNLNSGAEGLPEIEEIYERGINEYLYVPLWLEYIKFIEEHDQSVTQCCPHGISKMRDLYERALSAAGLHVTQGNKIWNAYREFEEAILLTVDDNNSEEKAKQVQCVRALYQRQLSIPLIGLKDTFLSYKQWEARQGNISDTNSYANDLDGIPASVASAYQKALDMYDARATYEDQLSCSNASDSDRLQYFMAYIKFEESSGNPTRVVTLYERAITEFPISGDLWLRYTSFLDKTLKLPKVLKDAYSRATKNCSWIGALWVQYLLSLERLGALEEQLSAVFEKSIQSVFSTFSEYLDLFLTRIDGLRRRIPISAANDSALDYSMIKDIFRRAADYLSSETIGTEDLLHLHNYWSRLETELGKDLISARGVWESLIKKSGSVSEFWKGYVDMEVRLGNLNEARSIYKRCYTKRFMGTGSEDICYSWLRFEREYGSLSDYDLAIKKVMPRLEELGMYRLHQASKNTTLPAAAKDSTASKGVPKKRKAASMLVEKQSSAKRQKDTSRKQVHGDFALESGNTTVTGKVESSPILSPKFSDPEMKPKVAEKSVTKDETPTLYTDRCTAFVSNLSLEANENHLREFFSDVGGVTAIRLLRDKFTGRSRGLAYIDFMDGEHLNAAIGKNKRKLLNKSLSIARSDPKQSQKKGSTRGGLAGGRGRSVSSGGKDDQQGRVDNYASKAAVSHRRGGHIQLTGKNTFALPRSVRPLGWSSEGSRHEEGEDKPKSNDDFRKMLTK